MTHIHHENNFSTSLASNANAGDTTSTLSDAVTVDAPFYLIYDATNLNGNYEVVYVIMKSGADVTHAALAHGHTAAETVLMSLSGTELDALQTSLDSAEALVATNDLVGEILMYGSASIPDGYLECNGAAVSRTTYATLFGVIGTLFGVGDGSTTFNVPNLKGSVAIGYKSTDSDFNAVGKTGGAKTVNLAHSHTQTAHTHSFSGTTNAGGSLGAYGGASNTGATNHTHTFSGTSGGMSDAGSNSQGSSTQSILNPYITLTFIIRT